MCHPSYHCIQLLEKPNKSICLAKTKADRISAKCFKLRVPTGDSPAPTLVPLNAYSENISFVENIFWRQTLTSIISSVRGFIINSSKDIYPIRISRTYTLQSLCRSGNVLKTNW